MFVVERFGVPSDDGVCLFHEGVQFFEHRLLAIVMNGLEDYLLLVHPSGSKADDLGAFEYLFDGDILLPKSPSVGGDGTCFGVYKQDSHGSRAYHTKGSTTGRNAKMD